MPSRDDLTRHGWLSLNGFVKYLKENHPQHQVSYPTVLRMVDKGFLRVVTVGQTKRVYREEITRYLAEGNYDKDRTQGIDPALVKEARIQEASQREPQLRLVPLAPLPGAPKKDS